MSGRGPTIVLVRHGETEWTRTGQHTGKTDIPLTDQGRAQGELLRQWLAERTFARVLTSPLERAAETCRLAGFGDHAERRDELVEVGLRRVRGAHDLADPRTAPELVPLARRLPRRRDGALGGGRGADLACHKFGWAVARRGSGSIISALASVLAERGGKVEAGVRVRSLSDLPPADAVVLDLAPAGVLDIAGDRLPARVARAYRRYRYGPGAFKLDLAVEGGIPWANEACRRAGTVHVGGTFEEIAAAERMINEGRMPERPFVLVSQQYLADPERSSGDVHPVWAYAHVPSGFDGDATEAVLAQIERFAPGLRERIVAQAVRPTAAITAGNANYVGGDIITGANTPVQTLIRPRLALDPYRTGIPGVFICSAATPPGAGAHGMNGHNAARSVLEHLR